MTKEQFLFPWNRLTSAFTVQKADDKGKIYFEELKHRKAQYFVLAVQKVIRGEERFPTIAVLNRYLEMVTPKTSGKFQKCYQCDGYGWQMIGKEAFRGDCEHGQKLSQSIRTAPPKEKWEVELFNQRQELEKVYGRDEDGAESSQNAPRAPRYRGYLSSHYSHPDEN